MGVVRVQGRAPYNSRMLCTSSLYSDHSQKEEK
jgi:hypothetical protein